MAKRIDSLQAEEQVTLHFHGSKTFGNPASIEAATFVRIDGTGDSRTATFRQDGTEWDAYRYNGGWAYGTSAERLSLV